MLLELRYEQQKTLLSKIGESVSPDQLRTTLNALVENANRPQATSVDSPLDSIVYEATSSVIRIGAVLVGIFLIQIMVTFARYYFKLASHLSMASALISLSNGKLTDLKSTAPLFMPSKIDFGKEPTSPTEKVLDGAISAIKELSRKIPIR
jgi:Ribonuclease G/E